MLVLLWLHVPIALAIGLVRGADWIMPTAAHDRDGLAATFSWRTAGNGLSTRLIFAVALMGGVSVFAYEMSGHPWQIDMHMYFFAALACLVAYCDYRPILAGTVAVALHHLALNFVFPAAIYPGGTDLGRVVLHAVILLIEAGVLIWLAFKLEQLFATTAEKTAEAEAANAAEARANAERVEAERQAKLEPDAAMRGLAAGFERKIGQSSRPSRSPPAKCRACRRRWRSRGNDAADGGRRRRIDPGLAQCRNRRLRDRGTDRLDQRLPSRRRAPPKSPERRPTKPAAPTPWSRDSPPAPRRSARS